MPIAYRYQCRVDERKEPHVLEDHRNSHLKLSYVLKGALKVRSWAKTEIAKAGDVFIKPIGCSYRETRGRGLSRILVVGVSDGDSSSIREATVLHKLTPQVKALLDLVVEESSAERSGTNEVLQGLGHALVTATMRLLPVQLEDVDHHRFWARQALALMEANVNTGKTVQDVLEPLNLSYRQVSRYVKDEFGHSPKKVFTLCKLAAAGHLLRTTDLPVTTIAYELGFSSVGHFSSAFSGFRQKYLGLTGMSPSEYRKASGMNKEGQPSMSLAELLQLAD